MKAKLRWPELMFGANKTELEFGKELQIQLHAGDLLWWSFEPIKLRLAQSCFYTPDFAVQLADQSMEFIEVKGFWRDDARVKIKTAARLFPMFTFTAVTKKTKKQGGGWNYEGFQ